MVSYLDWQTPDYCSSIKVLMRLILKFALVNYSLNNASTDNPCCPNKSFKRFNAST